MAKYKVEVQRKITEYWIVEADNEEEAGIFYVAQGEKIDVKEGVQKVNVSED